MGALKIPTYLDVNTALLADDEPEHLDWLIDFLKAKGISTRVATNVSQAMSIAQQKIFRIYIIDLNIPLGDWQPSLAQTGKTYDDYHGLYIIKLIRTQGLPGRRVIAYSAHHNEQIVASMGRLYSTYIVKGRPQQLKAEIEHILSRPVAPLKKRTTAAKKKLRIPRRKTAATKVLPTVSAKAHPTKMRRKSATKRPAKHR